MASQPADLSAPQTHEPFVPASTIMPEFTLRSILAGAILGVIFGVSSLYLVLKVGMSVSASIPVAVISITLFRVFSGLFGFSRTTILENNMAQTTGSAGESIAFGVGVTMPALLLLGFEMELWRVMLVAVLGGLLGIFMMIPLRRAFIVRLHGRPGEAGKLLYPEGTACAEVLISGEKGGSTGAYVFLGFFLAFAHKFLTEGLSILKGALSYPMTWFNKVAVLSTGMDAALLGVGYIIGPKTASVMMAGAVMGYLVLAPTIYTFGKELTQPLAPATSMLIKDMTPKELRSNYLLYVGAGCVAAAGIISMFRTFPMIVRSVKSGIADLGTRTGAGAARTDRDLPIGVTLVGSVGLVAILALFMSRDVPMLTAAVGGILIVAFGFLFVLVSSRLTGEIGSSSNPISGMTIATLLITCLIFLTMRWTSPVEQVLALTIGAVVCVAASNGGGTSQDLKTGFLVGATPILQQYGIIIGALTSALCMGAALLLFNMAGTIYSAKHAPDVNIADRMGALTQVERYQGQEYRVLRVTLANRDQWPGIENGKYLVDSTGNVKFLVDPTITGRLSERDDGTHVAFKFEAPKTQVMALIVNGVLGEKMNWGLVLLGVMVAIVLELCGLPALPFAVGMYISMADTAPIFIGGLVRFFAGGIARMNAGSSADRSAASVAESETSPGVLLSSGYVAGAALAGVAVALMAGAELTNTMDLSKLAAGWWGDATVWPTAAAFGMLIGLLIFIGARPSPKTD